MYIYIYICITYMYTYIYIHTHTCMAVFALTVIVSYLRLQGLNFGRKRLGIVFKTSGDHLLIQDLSRLSIEVSGILIRKTAACPGGFAEHALRTKGYSMKFVYVGGGGQGQGYAYHSPLFS